MNFKISGHHISITPAINDYIVNKFSKVLRHFDHVIDGHVKISVENQIHKAEITVHVPGKDIHCEASDGTSLYAAIDLLLDKVDRQVIKYKDKLQQHSNESTKRMVA